MCKKCVRISFSVTRPIPQGSDCVNPFIALQSCIKANPDAFSKDVLEDDDSVEEANHVEEPKPEYRIIPPPWAVETETPKHRL